MSGHGVPFPPRDRRVKDAHAPTKEIRLFQTLRMRPLVNLGPRGAATPEPSSKGIPSVLPAGVYGRPDHNMHHMHSVKGRNHVGFMQNMSVDLMGKWYSLANKFSLRIMNCVQTHPGHVIFVPDHEMAEIHNDVKQFIGLAAMCQSLIKHKHANGDKAPRFPHRNPSGMLA
ncbi:hypothetical protein GOODEAATRI_027477 [Goodea atripinnis]|uniref:Uncharacterized protein n=1 Tax=Goodea atripinnis TaxID=208336 RepID=A0ABV0PHQ0_9TELE